MQKAFSEAQRRLLRKHGTPAEFAAVCYAAVPGWISMAEASKAVTDYQIEWDNAE